MTIQAFVNVLNELQELEIDRNGGDDAYIFIENNPDVREKLAKVGVTEQEIRNVGDDNSFCLLALAFSKYPGQLEYDGTFRLLNEITIKQLYDTQHIMDKDVIKDKGLEGQDLLPNTILALQVEVAELANEWRGFKHWSNRQTPTMYPLEECTYCEQEVSYTRPSPFFADIEVNASMCEECWNMTKKEYADSNGEYIDDFKDYPHFKTKTPKKLLEEYADCLCFFLSIARQIGLSADEVKPIFQKYIIAGMSTVRLFSVLLSKITEIPESSQWSKTNFQEAYSYFREIGDRLGLTWEQITEAYMEKNKINYERLAKGY